MKKKRKPSPSLETANQENWIMFRLQGMIAGLESVCKKSKSIGLDNFQATILRIQISTELRELYEVVDHLRLRNVAIRRAEVK